MLNKEKYFYNIRLITEGELTELLSEERHYPSFVHNMVDEFSHTLYNVVYGMISNRIENKRKGFVPKNNNIVHSVLYGIHINYNDDINQYSNYRASYISDFYDKIEEKINCATIEIYLPSINNTTNIELLDACLTHEVQHLYDDWFEQKNGKETIANFSKNVDTTRNLANALTTSSDYKDIMKAISATAYLGLKMEMKAFVTQSFSEFKRIDCNCFNYKQKYKDTLSYKNYNKIKTDYINIINNAEQDILELVYNRCIEHYKDVNIPKVKNKEDLKQVLTKWANNIYNIFIHKYGSILSYWLDSHSTNEMLNRHFTIFSYML